MHRTHNIGGNGITAYSLGNTEVGNLNLTVLANHNILRLDIPVNDMVVVSRFNTHGYLDGNTNRFLYRESLLFFDIFL